MIRFLSLFFLLFLSFLLEQSILLPFGLSPGGFLVPFLVFTAGVSLSHNDAKRWFVICASILAGLFSSTPLFSFVLFMLGGVSFLALQPLISFDGAFSFLAALWVGAAIYLSAASVLWVSSWVVGYSGIMAASSLASFLASTALFAFNALAPLSLLWWFVLYRRGHGRFYALR